MPKQELHDVAGFALERLAALGASGAEVALSRGRSEELNVDAGEFSLLRTTFDSSLRMRALVGGRKGMAATNSLAREDVGRAAEQAVGAARSSEPDGAEAIAGCIGEHSFSLGSGDCDLDGLYGLVGGFMGACKQEFPKVDILQLVSQHSASGSLYANSNGTRVFTESACYSHSVSACARDGDDVSSINGYDLRAADIGKPLLADPELRRIMAEMEPQLSPAPVEGKRLGALLVSPACFAEFIYYVLHNSVFDSALIAGDSPWKGKLGEAVADRRLDVSLDPLDPSVVCGARVTWDGHLAARQDIIRGGELVGWALTQYGANKTGLARGGNVSDNIIIGTGVNSFDDLVAAVGDGLLLNRFSGGTPASNGDFSGVAKNSFLIRGGKVRGAVSETMISGNLLDMLFDLIGLGDEAVSEGSWKAPWAAFGGVTISGK